MKYYEKVNRVLWIILWINVAVAVIKIVLAILMGSRSLLADGFHGVTDSTANLIGIIGIYLAKKPADKRHPYGYEKFETIASMMIGILLFYITVQIIYNAFTFDSSKPRSQSTWGLVVLGGTLLTNIFVALIEYRLGKKYESTILITDSIHTRSDILISFGVLVTIILIRWGVPPLIDPIFSIIIAVLIFLSVIQILKKSIATLVDSNVLEEGKIKDIVYQTSKKIIHVHGIRSRGNVNQLFIDMHTVLSPEMTIEESHRLSHLIQERLQRELNKEIDLITHVEPYEGSMEEHFLHHDRFLKES